MFALMVCRFLFVITLGYGIWKIHAQREGASSQSSGSEELDAQRAASKVGEAVTEIPV